MSIIGEFKDSVLRRTSTLSNSDNQSQTPAPAPNTVYSNGFSLKDGIPESECLEVAGAIDRLIANDYGNSDMYPLEKTDDRYSFIWEKLSYCNLSFLESIAKQIPHKAMLDDILIWNTSHSILLGNEYQPICLEFRISRKNHRHKPPDLREVRKNLFNTMASNDEVYLPSALIDKSIFSGVKDKTIRTQIISTINVLYMGEDAESCRAKFGKIVYHMDELGCHNVLIENPPTLSYSFLSMLKVRFSMALAEIRFEKLPDKLKGLMVGTCMILIFYGEMNGIVRASKKRIGAGGSSNPY